MISCILIGHGDFAPGLYSSLEMIAGKQEDFEVITFKDGDVLDDFEKKLKDTVKKLYEKNNNLLIFSDLMGGTPFRTAMVVTNELENSAVITGTNLPMLVEGSFARQNENDAKSFAKTLVESAREGIQMAELPKEIKEDDMSSEGI